MSITPVPTAPTVAPATPSGETGGSSEPTGGTFAALVSSLLGGGQAAPAGGPGGTAPAGPAGTAEAGVVLPATAEEEPADSAVGEGETAGTPPSVGAPLWQMLAGQLAPAPATGAPSPAAPDDQDASGAIDAVAAGAVTVSGDAETIAQVSVDAGSTKVGADSGMVGADSGKVGAGSGSPQSSDAPAQAVAEPATASAAVDPQAATTVQPAADPATAPTTSTSGAGPAPVAATSAPSTAPTEGARPMPVVSQLAPEVTRMVSRGDGLHRLTMLLQPEALGEVRVTLTVRDGEVHVRLAAGDDAQRALLEGAPELRRVLELAGAGDARVVVRDLPSTTSGNQQGFGQSPERSADLDFSGAFGNRGDTSASGHGRTQDQDQHARTHGGSTATDGLTDGADQHRHDPVGRALRGIDLTM